MKQLKIRIKGNKRIADKHYVLSLESKYLAKETKPGQFINVKCDDGLIPLLRKPFSVHRINKDGIDIQRLKD